MKREVVLKLRYTSGNDFSTPRQHFTATSYASSSSMFRTLGLPVMLPPQYSILNLVSGITDAPTDTNPFGSASTFSPIQPSLALANVRSANVLIVRRRQHPSKRDGHNQKVKNCNMHMLQASHENASSPPCLQCWITLTCKQISRSVHSPSLTIVR